MNKLEGGLPKILALPCDDGGCGWYRVRQILAKMNELEIATTHVVDEKKDTGEELEEAITYADAVITRNEVSHQRIMAVMREKLPDKRFIFDHDDNTFLIQPSNEHYKDHGVMDVVDEKTGIELWKTGERGFDAYENRKKRVALEYLLEQSTLNTAPTKRLAELWGTYNGNGKMVPNCINFEWYPDVTVRDNTKGDELRIGWQGGVSHAGDFREVGKEVAKVMRKNKNVVYYSIGAFWKVFFKGVEDRCRILPWTAFRAHPYRMLTFDLDIAIIPLQDVEFNYFKSEVKFSEFAALKVPCLVKNEDPYKDFIEDGVTAMAYNSEKEFGEKLTELVRNEGLRKKLVKNAYDWVRAERDLDKWAPKILDTYLHG